MSTLDLTTGVCPPTLRENQWDLQRFFCGDSNTAAGRSWSLRIFGHPFASINLAGDGYRTDQITSQVRKAGIYYPEVISVLAGMNDILSGKFEKEKFRQDYKNLIEEALGVSENVIITLIPWTSQKNPDIGKANDIITELLLDYDVAVIDLNPQISENRMLLDSFTTDGVHPNERALQVWESEIMIVLEKQGIL